MSGSAAHVTHVIACGARVIQQQFFRGDAQTLSVIATSTCFPRGSCNSMAAIEHRHGNMRKGASDPETAAENTNRSMYLPNSLLAHMATYMPPSLPITCPAYQLTISLYSNLLPPSYVV